MPRDEVLQGVVDEVTEATSKVAWSVCITGVHGEPIAAANGMRSLRTASVGKVLLLTELAAQLETGDEHEQTLLARTSTPRVGGSGLLQYLVTDRLSIGDLAVLVAATSDNFATNILLARVGLEKVQQRADSLGLCATALHDQVRDDRGPDTPETLSTGSAAELSQLMAAAARDQLVSPSVSRQLRNWLGLNADTSMVASAFDLDPLEHSSIDATLVPAAVFNKTGTDNGVRADVGWVEAPAGASPNPMVAYAAIADWGQDNHDSAAAVLAGMRLLGQGIRQHLKGHITERPT